MMTPFPLLILLKARCNILVKIFALLFFFAAFSFAETYPPCPNLTIFSDVTDSGIKTYVAQIPRAKSVSVSIFSRGGAFAENEKRGSGLAHAVQFLIFENI
jgi:hypothetical protein